MSKQVKNTVAVLAFFDQQKVSGTNNENNSATYTAKSVILIVRVVNFLSIFAKKRAVKSPTRSRLRPRI